MAINPTQVSVLIDIHSDSDAQLEVTHQVAAIVFPGLSIITTNALSLHALAVLAETAALQLEKTVAQQQTVSSEG